MDIFENIAPTEQNRYPILLAWPEIEELTGLKKPQAKILINRGEFPAPLKLSQRIHRFDLEEVVAWLRNRYAEREQRHAG